MDGAKASKSLQKEQEREEHKAVSALVEEDLNLTPSMNEGKGVFIMIAVLVGIFALTLGGFKLYNSFGGTGAIVIDDLHDQNLNGELPEEEGYVYNGFSVVKADGLWWTEVESESRLVKIPLHFGPKEVENIPLTGKISSAFNDGDKIYVAINPAVNYNKYYTLALMELNNNILQGISRPIEAACTAEDPACENRTIINCENTQGKPVIELAISDQPSVTFQGSCMKVSGNDLELAKAVDRLLYYWYGIIN